MNRTTLVHNWMEDLNHSRDISQREKEGFTFVLTWFERWRNAQQLPPGREAACGFWKSQVRSSRREQWQLDQWAEAFRWYLGWLDWCQKSGKDARSLEERVRSAVNNAGGRRGLSLNTRKVYSSWAGRFARWAGDERAVLDERQAREFLSHLVTQRKVAFSTQKQALNALAFFYKEVCGRPEVDLEITLRRTPKRIPVVLNLHEIAAILNNLPPTCRLAAELQYGSGVRLAELLNLRVKDIDTGRHQVTVRAGKGDRDRVTVLPKSMVPRLEEWKQRIHELHRDDRNRKVPGVFLPGAFARKNPAAAEKWSWFWLFPGENLSTDPDTGIVRRHHLHPENYSRALRQAVAEAGISEFRGQTKYVRAQSSADLNLNCCLQAYPCRRFTDFCKGGKTQSIKQKRIRFPTICLSPAYWPCPRLIGRHYKDNAGLKWDTDCGNQDQTKAHPFAKIPTMMGKFNFILIAATLISLPALLAEEKPNFVIIFADDQGYGDLGCFGSTTIKTPNIDRMATEGRRFTNFMVASPVCTPSRAALLTGCYPKRVGMHQHVLFPQSTKGLNPEEHTIADHLKAQGYATACFGKWHLGHHPETLPQQNGFDTYFGIPYSNDMNHPDNKGKPTVSSDDLWKDQESTLTLWKTPLMENAKIVELPVDQRTVTRRYTDRAVEFITTNKNKPFFVYLPHSMPHIPLYVPEDVYDPDPKNAYINVIEHIDAEVGRVLNTIRDLNLADNTYVIYTSDNGPWLRFGTHGGSAGPLRDGKGTTFEGGQRVPCVMWAPGKIPAGSECPDLVGTIDLLPTIAAITESPLPEGKKIDGLNISAAIHGRGESPRKKFIYYTSRGALEGIRVDQWKLLVKTPAGKRGKGKGKGQQSGATPKIETLLFNLDSDMEEANNVAGAHPEIVKELTAQMQEYDAEITENARAPWEKPY